MEVLDLLSKCPGSSRIETLFKRISSANTQWDWGIETFRWWMVPAEQTVNQHICNQFHSRNLLEMDLLDLCVFLFFFVSFYFSLCLFIFLCVVLFVFVSFWPLGLCSAAGLLDKSRRSAGNAVLIWKIFEGSVCQGWQGAGTLGAMGALEGGHL